MQRSRRFSLVQDYDCSKFDKFLWDYLYYNFYVEMRREEVQKILYWRNKFKDSVLKELFHCVEQAEINCGFLTRCKYHSNHVNLGLEASVAKKIMQSEFQLQVFDCATIDETLELSAKFRNRLEGNGTIESSC